MIRNKSKIDNNIHQPQIELLSSKSSTAFVSTIISKPTIKTNYTKSSINISKIIKPSASIFKKYMHRKVDETEASYTNLTIEEIKKDHSIDTIFTKINEESLKKTLETLEKIKIINEENIRLQNTLLDMKEIETKDVIIMYKERNNESKLNAMELIENKAINYSIKHKTSEEIVEEIAKFIITRKQLSSLAINRIRREITNFFSAPELKEFYFDIIIALSKRIITEINKHKNIISETEKLNGFQKKTIINLRKSINQHAFI